MSVRMLQRALRSNEKFHARINEDESSADEAVGVVGNSFDLLGTNDESEGFEEEGCASVPIDPKRTTNPLQGSGSSRKAKKKKNKGKKVACEIPQEDDVDVLLKKLSLSDKADAVPTKAPGDTAHRWALGGAKLAEILTVDIKQLRAEDELRRIFGSKVINSVERGSSSTRVGGLRHRQGNRPKGVRGNFLRRTTLVAPKEFWPYWDNSISMELQLVKDGIQHFRYTFTPSYVETQKKFQMSGAGHDPNLIIGLLQQHGYHLESLMALAELYKNLGDYQESVDCLERCLFALECAWHPSFYPFNGSCRLLFEHESNRPFFLVLFKHMLHLGRRGCHHSAFEVCKLLLSLDADDPLGALFAIDYFALRAEEYQWLEQFADCYSSDSSLRLLPNYSFSLAIARFYCENQPQQQEEADLSKSQAVTSHDLLKQALLLHPAALHKLVDKTPIKEDAEWGRILRHPHFKKATPGGPSLEHLINLYVEKNYLIWRVPNLQTQLKGAALAVMEAADMNSGEVANWACVRQEAFSSEQNEYRHLHLTEFADAAPPMMREELQNMMVNGNGDDNERQNATLAGLEGSNVFRVFLQSLFPWNVYGVDLQGQDAEQLVEAAAADEESESD